MQVSHTNEPASQITADAVVVGIYSHGNWGPGAKELDSALQGALHRLQENKEVSGKFGEVAVLLATSGISAKQVAVVGLGDREKFNRGRAFRAAAAASKRLAGRPRQRVVFYLGEDWNPEELESGIAGSMVGCTGQDLYRSEKKLTPPDEISWSLGSAETLEAGQILGTAVNLTRRLVNEPPSAMYPETFASEAQEVARSTGLSCEVWDEQRLAEERCGSLLAVARGSSRPPRLVMLRYAGADASAPWLTLVGKGVTFDSGGLSIKPSDGMKTMKCDMAGAATVLGAMQAIARLKLPVNVFGLMGLVENMVSGNSYKLGDVLTARSGKTIEVLNTDAEGRLVLADVLNVAVEKGADKLIDLATLTGACVVALGNDVAGAMSNDDSWRQSVLSAAERCGEAAWPLPMFEEFGDQIRSEVADIKNIGDGRWGGAITAAKFLEEFVEKHPWVHLDIAGPAFAESAKPWLDGGGTGAFVRTLVEVARTWNRDPA